jgi:hypothetical protein
LRSERVRAAGERLLAAARAVRGQAILFVVYLILRALLDRLAEDGGPLTISGSVRPGFVLLAMVVLPLRMVAVFVLPPTVAYRLIVRGATPPSARVE